jgi:nitrite reductase/ring-hydroxylating ferredoxin subunit
MKWHKIPGVQHTPEPFIKKVTIGLTLICLVGYEGEIFALSALCPHQGFDLSGGSCKYSKLICPLHGYSYDLRTGKGSEGQNDKINTYAVDIRDNDIYIGLPTVWDSIKQVFNKR